MSAYYNVLKNALVFFKVRCIWNILMENKQSIYYLMYLFFLRMAPPLMDETAPSVSMVCK